MAYPQRLLSEGETIHYELKPHWRALLLPAVTAIVIVFLGTWLYFAWDQTIWRWIILGAGVVFGIWRVLLPFLRWLSTQYVFTDRRIIVRSGILTKRGRDMPLSKINNVTFSVPFLGRFLNYGELQVVSAGTEGDLLIDDVPNVEEIQRDIYHLFELDDSRRRKGGELPSTDGT
jgi:uncharacterized membrane protein YdbT with pleckstrin-like domain